MPAKTICLFSGSFYKPTIRYFYPMQALSPSPNEAPREPSSLSSPAERVLVAEYQFSRKHSEKYIMPSLMALVGATALMLMGTLFIEEANGARLGFLLLVFGLSSPFVFPDLYHYLRYFDRDHKTRLEVDMEEGFIMYENPRERLLFHKDQIESCEIRAGILAPLRLKYLKLQIAGKGAICISSLVVEPLQLASQLGLAFTFRQNLFNPIP
jgi:hypothetical protein